MSLHGFTLVALAALLTAVANLLLRGGVLRAGGLALDPAVFLQDSARLLMEPFFVLGVFFYGAAAVVWFSALSSQDLSIGYPVLVGLTFLLVGSGAALLFHEALTLQRVAGMALIVGGVAIVGLAR